MRYVIFFFVASLVMGGSHYYVWTRLVRDSGLPQPWARVATIAMIALFVLLMSGFILGRALPRSLAGPFMWVGYSWLGMLFFLFIATAVTDAGRFITLRVTGSPDDPERRAAIAKIFAGAAAVLGVGASGVAVAGAVGTVGVKKVKVVLDKLSKSSSGYRIVQITDVHVGPTIGKGFIEEVVAHINALEPDCVVITGDLVDGSVEELAEHVAPLGKLKAKDGVFFVTGNHEYYSGAAQWVAHLPTLGIKVLRNERVALRGFDLAGIDDFSARGMVPGHGADLDKALEGRDPKRPVVLLAHQPKAIEGAANLGVDLQLSGHTHGGQIFPWNYMVRLQQPFVDGLHKLREAQIYVSRGTGWWGPPMRLGAPAEITEIELVSA